MMAFKNKSMLFAASLLSSVVFYSNSAEAYTITADEIYRQARQKNYGFFQRLARYNGAVNMQNRSGDTAYCVALRYNDEAAQEILLNFGAKDNHPCVRKINDEKEQYARRETEVQRRYSRSLKLDSDTGNNYLWWGLGALAVGGGVAALASSGGGGSSGSNAASAYACSACSRIYHTYYNIHLPRTVLCFRNRVEYSNPCSPYCYFGNDSR